MRPNILIFNPDQMRRDTLGHMGNKAAYTPNLDKIVEEGVSFSNVFCQSPVCTPSRCSFMTGWYPHVHGHRTISYLFHNPEPILLTQLKNNGYYVWINDRNDILAAQIDGLIDEICNERVGGQDIMNMGNQDIKPSVARGEKGGDNFYSFYNGVYKTGDKEYEDSDYGDVKRLIDFIKNRPKDKPICMFLGLMNPHPPYVVPEKYYKLIDKTKLPERIKISNWEKKPSLLKGLYDLFNLGDWEEERWDKLRATYLAMCTRVDNFYKMVVDTLKKEGIYDDTAIFVMSDHGDFTGDYSLVEKTQNTFEDPLVNVPFIVKPHKDLKPKTGINDALVELVDFYATVLDFAEVKSNHTHFGKSLKKLIEGKDDKIRDVVFSEGGRLAEERHCTETYNLKWLLQKESLYYPRMKVQDSYGPEHTKATMCRTKKIKYVKRLYEKDELYDLTNDPKELNNLIDDDKYKDIREKLQKRMLDWYQETADVVPFEEDDRFSKETMLLMLKHSVSKELYDKIEEQVRTTDISLTRIMGAIMG